jgi:hypothetical protein
MYYYVCLTRVPPFGLAKIIILNPIERKLEINETSHPFSALG